MTDETSLSTNSVPIASSSEGVISTPPAGTGGESSLNSDFNSVITPPLPPAGEEVSLSDDTPSWYFGLGESLLWFLGTFAVHLIGGIAMLIVAMVVTMALSNGAKVEMNNPRLMMVATAGEMVLFVLAAIVCVSVRYWGRTFAELNLSRPERKHVAIVIAGTLPLCYCVSAYSIPIQWGWTQIGEQFPGLKWLDSLSAMEMIKDMASSISLPMMILILAVMPAIGEELVFRGAIGRVLIAPFGLWVGIALTSFLFGLIHVHPVHALSVIPLGIAIHLVYLWTRSFWMPMLFHFVNNCWAALTAQHNSGEPIPPETALTMFDVVGMISAMIAVTALAIALFQSRIRYFQTDGSEWSSPHYPLRVPPSKTIQRRTAPIRLSYGATGFCFALACHLIMGWQLWKGLMEPQ